MKPLHRGQGNQHLHREDADYRRRVSRKIKAYNVFVFAGIVAPGLLHYLAACHVDLVWQSFGSWLRTIRPNLAPFELVVSIALRHSFGEFLWANKKTHALAQFITERLDSTRVMLFRAVG